LPLLAGLLFCRLFHPFGSSNQVLMTIIHNAQIHMLADGSRWLSARQCLMALGFAVSPQLTVARSGLAIHSCNFSDGELYTPDRSRTTMVAQAGNSMAAVQCGAVWLHVFAMIEPLASAFSKLSITTVAEASTPTKRKSSASAAVSTEKSSRRRNSA
jgi:hypothetical protein